MPHSESGNDGPRILFLDAYDSFSNNIIALLELELGAEVHVTKIDDEQLSRSTREEFAEFLSHYDAVVAGPGPGNPTSAKDVGLIGRLWSLETEHDIPILGICLGFQSLAYAFGARIERLVEPRHGIIQRLTHCDSSIFKAGGEVLVTQYHSLCARLEHPLERLCSASLAEDSWLSSTSCPDLMPLCWSLEDTCNGPTLTGVHHRTRPFCGVQFHPESICTNEAGSKIIKSWWKEALRWRTTHREVPSRGRRQPQIFPNPISFPSSLNSSYTNRLGTNRICVNWRDIDLGNLDVGTIFKALSLTYDQVLLLESGVTAGGRLVNSETGRFSIIGYVESRNAEHYQYFPHMKRMVVIHISDQGLRREEHPTDDAWEYFAGLMAHRKVADGPDYSPFWGGLVGYVSYESCLGKLRIETEDTGERPGIWFTFVRRSIVVDHVGKQVYVQSLNAMDDTWIADTINLLERLKLAGIACETSERTASGAPAPGIKVHGPSETEYCRKVRECQSCIRAGDSYELCLTSETKIILPASKSHNSAWDMYLRLRKRNPAPFSACLRMCTTIESTGVTILSSSPERFLSWSRNGSCQFRPIKGTVPKSIPGMTRDKAEGILQSTKEQAENLMIVDLVRHDLHGVVGAGKVHVKKLMGVEEYETVYQLVSVIEGQFQPAGNQTHRIEKQSKKNISGIEVLAASLPPGSMTGAPKRRSCELLREIENNEPRGIYSGVLGYLDVGGGGDFSVVIRTAYRWDDDIDAESGGEFWRVGAGGAVTSQSTDRGEYEEMCVKREALLRAFEA